MKILFSLHPRFIRVLPRLEKVFYVMRQPRLTTLQRNTC